MHDLWRVASSEITLEAVPSVSDIPAAEWDACANPKPDAGALENLDTLAAANDSCAGSKPHYNPFVSHAFFAAAEASGSATARTGWGARHLIAKLDGKIAGIVPCYVKSHSQGEYVFDWGWADAYERAGGRYYPKLQVSVPFTPVTGPRLLAGAGPGADERKKLLAAGLMELCRRLGASSAHLTFLSDEDRQVLGELGFLERTDQQFHWADQGYGDFDGFLAALASRKRKAIRKERRDALAGGVSIEWVTGRDITERHWDSFFAF